MKKGDPILSHRLTYQLKLGSVSAPLTIIIMEWYPFTVNIVLCFLLSFDYNGICFLQYPLPPEELGINHNQLT